MPPLTHTTAATLLHCITRPARVRAACWRAKGGPRRHSIGRLDPQPTSFSNCESSARLGKQLHLATILAYALPTETLVVLRRAHVPATSRHRTRTGNRTDRWLKVATEYPSRVLLMRQLASLIADHDPSTNTWGIRWYKHIINSNLNLCPSMFSCTEHVNRTPRAPSSTLNADSTMLSRRMSIRPADQTPISRRLGPAVRCPKSGLRV